MRRYREPAQVETDGDGAPVKFVAWGRDYLVTEILGPHWEELEPWWTVANAGKDPAELEVFHWLVRAHGRRPAVVELVRRGEEWFVEGIED